MTPLADRPWARRLRRIVTGVPFLVTAAVVVALFVAYTLAGFFLVPRLISYYTPRYVQEQLKRRAEIGEVRFNPLLFKLELKRFRVQEADGRPLLAFDRLFVDFELSSILRRAWTFAELQLDAPRVDAVLSRDGRLNLAKLLDAFPKSEPPPEPAPPPRMLIQHAVLRGGSTSFTDLSGRAPHTATLEPINIELHDVTTIRERRGPYAISAALDGGGVVGWEGEVSLNPVASNGRFEVRGFPLATAWRFVQDDLAVAEPTGQVDADVRYRFTYQDQAPAVKIEGLEVTVSGLALAQRDKTPLLDLEKIRLAGGRGDLTAHDLTVSEISVSRGRVSAIMARDGVVNWQSLMVTSPTSGEPPASTNRPAASSPAPSPWRVAVEKVRVEEIALSFVDQSRTVPLTVEVGNLSLDLSARLETGPAGPAGTVEGLGLKLARAALREAATSKTPVHTIDQIAVEGGRVDLGARQVTVSRVTVTGGVTSLTRSVDGSLPWVAMLMPADHGKPPAPSASAAARPRPAPATAEKPWRVALDRFEQTGHRVTFVDQSVTPAAAFAIDGIKVSAQDLQSDGKKPIPFDTSFRVMQGGRFTARGRVAPDGPRVDATLNLARLALPPAQPYIAQHAAVVLRSGEVSTAGRVTYRGDRGRQEVTFTGTADTDNLQVVEADGGEPVVGWKNVHAETIRFGLAPDRLAIDEVRLTELDGRLVIFKDKSLSLAKLIKPAGAPPGAAPGSGPGAPAAPAGAATPASPADAGPGFPITVDRVRVDNSSMSFADLSLVLPFATRVHTLNGVVAGLGSDADTRATMKLDGRVDEFGLVKVDGALSAFRPKLFTDIKVSFRNVPMNTLSPYSATFAGRRIRAGTMNVELEYKIDRSALAGDNKVVLQQLQLGERVESPGAMRLPLDLAIAILSDSDGKIDIDLPVRGNVDSPEFSYGHLIWQALVTVITKIVTSPFRALGGLFGGSDAEGLQAIAFEAGSDTVLPPEREKLKRVAEVLGKRPRLKLTVHGGYETKTDGEALRSLRVRADLAQRLGVKLKPGEDLGPVAFDQAKTQRALEAMLNERAGAKAVDVFQTGYEKTREKKAERANPLLSIVGRGSPDRDFYQALFRRLVEIAPLSDSEVTALGQRRGEAAMRVLKESAGSSAARVETGDTEAAASAERNSIPTRLELGAVGS
jgi:hypothetical protein